MSESGKRRWKNPQVIQKKSEITRGLINRKGLHHSLTTRQRMSEAAKWRCKNPRVIQKMSEITKGLWRNPEFANRVIKTLTGRRLSTEHKQKLSNIKKGHIVNIETRKKISEKQKGRVHHLASAETRSKMSASQKIINQNPKYIKRKKEILTELWKNPEFARRMLIAQGVHPNKSELKLHSILEGLFPENYKLNTRGEIITLGGKIPDIVNTNNQKKVIELFGTYWHRDQNPDDRIALFKPFGFETLVVWESELKDRPALEARLQEFHARPHLEVPNAG